MNFPTTSDYDQFVIFEFNRDVSKINLLENSMKQHGFIPAYPLHVVEVDGKFHVKGGHHRFTVAKKLGIPVVYAVCEDSASVYQLEKTTRKWTMSDYLASYVRTGNPDYIAVLHFHQSTGLNIGQCVSLLAGDIASSGNFASRFKEGGYKVTSPEYATRVNSVIAALTGSRIPWAKKKLCVTSISRIVKAFHTDLDRLIKKINKHAFTLSEKTTVEAYTDMWETLYNREATGKRVPIAFLTNEAMRELQILNNKPTEKPMW